MRSEVEDLSRLIQTRGYTRLIFDMDCTITQIQLPWGTFRENVAQQLSADTAASFTAAFRDPSISWGSMHNSHVDTDPDFHAIMAKKSQEFEHQYSDHQPYRELVDMIKSLPPNISCIIWSSNTRDGLIRILKELGLSERIERIVSRDEVRYIKPNPEGWKLIDNGTPREKYLFIGDSINDRLVAEAIGIEYFKIGYFRERKV